MGIDKAELLRAGLVETNKGLVKLTADTVKCSADYVADCKEKDLVKQILDECQRRHWMFFHGSTAHKARRTIGEPDLTIAADYGITYFVELKVGRNKLSAGQRVVRHALLALGHRYLECRSLSDFLEFVEKVELEK